MRNIMRLFSTVAFVAVVFTCATANAADDLLKLMGKEGGSQEKSSSAQSGDSKKGPIFPDISTGDAQQFLLRDQGLGEESARKTGKLEKPKINLKVEPGDSQALLSWNIRGLKDAAPRDVKYTLEYGSEPGKLDKKMSVGRVTSFKLRDLKNNQVYYVQVKGTSEEEGLQVVSEEIRVLPLPVEELVSSIENSFSKGIATLQEQVRQDPFKRDIAQFGYDFFKNSALAALSMENLPVGLDYVIGPGDTLRIDIWGGIHARHELTVDRNGEITIPKFGAVKVWGLKYGQAKDVIDKAISRYSKGYELNVTLGKLRTIQVFVVGEVNAPGAYNVSSLSTVINALAVAGGPAKTGSLRNIRLMRDGKLVQNSDLYGVFLSGDRSGDVRLENGDTVFVPVVGPVVAVAGEVKRAAIYELKAKTSLAEVLEMAGGITATGDTGRIQVERIEGNAAHIVVDFLSKGKSLSEELAGMQVLDRDMVKVFPVFNAVREVVSLKGNVVRPGEYQFRKGMRLADLIPSYSALLPDSYLEAGELIRLAQPDFHREVLSVNLKKALEGDEKENIPLQEQDTVRVFSRWEMQEKPVVSIAGQVVNPGSYMYYPKMTVRDLVAASGSLKRNAFLDNAELTRVVVEDGHAKSTSVHVNLQQALTGDPVHNLELRPDDALIVRGIENWLEAQDRFVTLRGEVRFPGTYSITKGERISSVLSRAGGYTGKAYLKGAKFTRSSVQLEQQKRMDEVITRSEQDILRKQGELASVSASKEELDATKAALDGLLKGLDKLRSVRAQGRVVLRLASLDEFRNSPYDLELMGGDTLEIPQTPSVVNVMGVVYNPTTLVHMPGKNISYYLQKAGGPMRDAEDNEMYIIKSDGSVFSKQQSGFGIRWDDDARSWAFGSFGAATMDPGDTLVVPQKLERVAWMRNIKDLTTILSQVALTAGTILIGLK